MASQPSTRIDRPRGIDKYSETMSIRNTTIPALCMAIACSPSDLFPRHRASEVATSWHQPQAGWRKSSIQANIQSQPDPNFLPIRGKEASASTCTCKSREAEYAASNDKSAEPGLKNDNTTGPTTIKKLKTSTFTASYLTKLLSLFDEQIRQTDAAGPYLLALR